MIYQKNQVLKREKNKDELTCWLKRWIKYDRSKFNLTEQKVGIKYKWEAFNKNILECYTLSEIINRNHEV